MFYLSWLMSARQMLRCPDKEEVVIIDLSLNKAYFQTHCEYPKGNLTL
jgi:hypothetical protein